MTLRISPLSTPVLRVFDPFCRYRLCLVPLLRGNHPLSSAVSTADVVKSHRWARCCLTSISFVSYSAASDDEHDYASAEIVNF